jgi:uncharacterized membrane protein YccC
MQWGDGSERMRLRAGKRRSQPELAAKARMNSGPGRGLFTFDRLRMVIHAAKTALAAALCWWLALRFGLHDGYWGSISAIIVLQSNVGATVSASRDRLLGTLIGALFGFAFSLVGASPWNYILALFCAIVVCGLLSFRESSRLAAVTITIIMLVPAHGSRWALALDRVGEVLLGIVIALLVSTLVFPDRARLWLRNGLAQEFLLLGGFFEAILEGFLGPPSQKLPVLREDLESLLSANSKLLEAARNEPSGAGWREGLSLLSEFGRSLFEALLALDFAVKDSHEDRFAQQLEPALSRLAADIHARFDFIADCVHKWRFSRPQEGVSLERDVADLEARMDAVRHTGVAFSQAELLRAYAVQLHLKQIARLLRDVRIETSRAVGQASNEEETA